MLAVRSSLKIKPKVVKQLIHSCFFYKNVKFWIEPGDFLNFPILSQKMILILRHSKSESKVRIDGNIDNKNCLTTRVDPKTIFEPYPDPQNSPFWLEK